jgi:aryl-alcohol dehydrogenase-like predicted oxidoreductase
VLVEQHPDLLGDDGKALRGPQHAGMCGRDGSVPGRRIKGAAPVHDLAVRRVHAFLDRNRVVRKLTQRYDATPRQVVLAWLLARSPQILPIPIPGTGSISHLEDNIVAAAIKLTQAEVAVLAQPQSSLPASRNR